MHIADSKEDARRSALAPQARDLTHRDVLVIALPITLSNATTPLIGFADTVVVGQLGTAYLIGAVAISSQIFNVLYWVFGFLRMGTTGLTAQAAGANDGREVAANLFRALLIAVGVGVAMIACRSLIAQAAFWFIAPSAEVEAAARIYFDVRIWGAPAGLINFALLGWFIGLGRAVLAFWLQLLLNVLNIVLAVWLVMILDLGVWGVGLAALIAEITAAVAGLWVAAREFRRRAVMPSLEHVLNLAALRRALQVNSDIMLRTICLSLAVLFFMAQGAQAGDQTLAANAVLWSISMICVYLLDGFAFAAETLVGQAVGAGLLARFRHAAWLTTLWAAVLSLVLAAIVFGVGSLLIDFATTAPDVRTLARTYLVWAALLPVAGVWAFQLDGIYIGATRTAEMRNWMFVSMLVYFAAWLVLAPRFGNHGLWASYYVFFGIRALTLYWRLPALERATFPEAAAAHVSTPARGWH